MHREEPYSSLDNTKKFEIIKRLSETVDWKVEEERQEFLRRIQPLIKGWRSEVPDLREILRPDVIERLLADSLNCASKAKYNYQAKRWIKFVVASGYKDEGKIDETGSEAGSRRTTPIHHASRKRGYSELIHRLFHIYDAYDVNCSDDSGLTHLHVACMANCERVVEKFLDAGQHPDCLAQDRDHPGFEQESIEPPLHTALAHNSKQVSKLLLRRGANPNLANAQGLTPLHVICRRKKDDNNLTGMFFETCEEMQQRVRIDARDKLGQTPLHLALRYNNNGNLVEKLLRLGAHPNSVNAKGSSPLHMICERDDDDDDDDDDKDDDAAGKLLERFFKIGREIGKPVRVDARDKLGWTPLHLALKNGQRRLTELLLRQGADPCFANGEGWTALHIITKRQSDAESAKIISQISEGRSVRIDARDKLGNTPLHLALVHGFKKKTVLALLAKGADPNLANSKGLTPLHTIVKDRDNRHAYDMAKMLFKISDDMGHSVWIDARDKKGRTPLELAVTHEKADMVELLLKEGANPNLANEDGFTALHIIIKEKCDNDLGKMLFELSHERHRPLQVDAEDKLGWTPLHFAMSRGNKAMMEMLLRNGADPNSIDAKRWTPLHMLSQDCADQCDLAEAFFEICDSKLQPVQVDVPDEEGNTPLHLILRSGQTELAKSLLRRSVDPNLANDRGVTPLHIICQRRYDDDLAKTFFELNDEKRLTVEVDALDDSNRTPLQWAVANLLPGVVDILLSRGADLTSFVFPSADYFGKTFALWLYECNLKLRLASGAVCIVESLWTWGYDLARNDALTVMKFFDEYELLQRPDALRCRETQRELVTSADYYEFARNFSNWDRMPESYRAACAESMCEKVSKRAFRRWALYPFLDLINYRLPIEICEIIIKPLLNKDLYNICLADEDQSS